MKKPKRKKGSEEYNFWQPATDMMTGIVFILMLIVALLCLYILNTYNSDIDDEVGNEPYTEELTDSEYGDASETETETETEMETWWDIDDEEDGGGGGDGETETETETETERTAGGYGEDEGIKSAVLVKLVDEETDRLIPIAGIRFELYGADSGLQILNTYYPEKISYREFETKEDGTFYLPEKIYEGTYFFKELNEPEGYDAADDTYFTIDDLYDWPAPYVVTIPVSPSKNIIRVQTKDKETGQALEGASYQVTAAEDITTLDGTVRYTKGEVVDTITCDEDGYGESIELYLGNYTLKQADVPEYYAGMTKTLKVEVEKKDGTEVAIQEAALQKTSVTVTLTDELSTSTPLANVEFTVTADDESVQEQTFRTDANGSFEITDMVKGTTYHIREADAPEDYQADLTDYTVDVDATGWIDGDASAKVNITNRLLRVTVNLTERVLGGSIPEEKELHLYNSAGAEVESWTYYGSSRTLEGLEEGDYTLTIGDDAETQYVFRVENTAEIQKWEIPLLTWRGIAALAGAAAAAVLALVLAILGIRALIRRRKKKKKQKSDG